MKKTITALSLVAALALAGCTTTAPDAGKPNIGTPAAWSRASGQGAASPTRDWWRNFGNRELDTLMEKALAGNADIRASIARIAQARADLKIAGASLYPSVDASGGADISREKPARGNWSTEKSANAGLDVSYELDLFGGNRASRKASAASLEETVFDADALNLVTMADTASAFFTILALRDRIAIAQESLNSDAEVLRIVEARVNAGAATSIDRSRQQTALSQKRASLRSLEEQASAAENALAVLLGQTPDTLSVLTRSVLDVSQPEIDAGQPSSLLERRPDIKASEAALAAAAANIDVARAAMFPSVNIGAGFSLLKSPIGDPAATALGLAASLAAPLFQGGRLEGGVEKATARQTELAEDYRKTVLIAFQETEDALESTASASDRTTLLETAASEAQNAYDLTRKRFDAGAIDLEAVMDAQESLLSARDSLAQARAARLLASVDLYKALGGGWR